MDVVLYRFPGEKICRIEGSFIRVNSLEGADGFIVSDFSGKSLFLFVEGLRETNKIPSGKPTVLKKNEYLKNGKAFLSDLMEQKLEKAVFSRIKLKTLNTTPTEAFNLLEQAYPDAFVYLIESNKLGTWIGASPELLGAYEKGVFSTHALAGTLPVNGNIEWTDKEIKEQQAVTSFINQVAKRYASSLTVDGPYEINTGAVRHLRTDISFPLVQTHVLSLLSDLHPTPAVAGLPVHKAMELIQKHETHKRKLYTGYLGRISSESVTVYVNLRCAEIIGKQAFLYLGGGYNAQSRVDFEWEETENKSRTLLNILK
jgi:isochorismate synthase